MTYLEQMRINEISPIKPRIILKHIFHEHKLLTQLIFAIRKQSRNKGVG